MKSPTSVAILLASHNGEEYIAQQIESILNQSFEDWTIFISDDSSTDKTVHIIQQYAERFPEKIVWIKKDESSGSAKNNFLFLLRQVDAEYLMCCDQDDVWKPEKIEITMQLMKQTEEVGRPALVFTDLQVVDHELNLICSSFFKYTGVRVQPITFRRLLVQNIVAGCTAMFNGKLRDYVLMPEKTDDIIMHDWWFSLIAVAFGKIGFCPQSTILYRQHGTNAVGAQKTGGVSYVFKRLCSTRAIQDSRNTILQAKLFYEVYSDFLSIDCKTVLQAYSKCLNKNKLKRIYIISKNRIWKDTITRKAMQIFFC